jgi:hypothetical protein
MNNWHMTQLFTIYIITTNNGLAQTGAVQCWPVIEKTSGYQLGYW